MTVSRVHATEGAKVGRILSASILCGSLPWLQSRWVGQYAEFGAEIRLVNIGICRSLTALSEMNCLA